jgi:uncharacterized protein YegP (UPF0339 family)
VPPTAEQRQVFLSYIWRDRKGADVTVHIYKGAGLRNWRVRLVADNGSILAISEGYYSRWNARRAAKRMFPLLPVKDVQR